MSTLPLPCFFSNRARILALGIGAQQQDRRFQEGPREIGMADLCAGSAVARPGRCPGARDEAAGGHAILSPQEAMDIVDVLEQDQAENLANSRYSL